MQTRCSSQEVGQVVVAEEAVAVAVEAVSRRLLLG